MFQVVKMFKLGPCEEPMMKGRRRPKTQWIDRVKKYKCDIEGFRCDFCAVLPLEAKSAFFAYVAGGEESNSCSWMRRVHAVHNASRHGRCQKHRMTVNNTLD